MVYSHNKSSFLGLELFADNSENFISLLCRYQPVTKEAN